MKRLIILMLILLMTMSLFSATVRWKDKAELAGGDIADDDYIPITDKSGPDVDKHFTPDGLATYLATALRDKAMTMTAIAIDEDAGTNAITNLANASIKAAAAIALSKLAMLANHDRALISDGSGEISESAVTATELAKLDGVTWTTAESNILDAGESESISDNGTQIDFQTDAAVQLILDDGILSGANNDIDLGSDAREFKDIWIDGTGYFDAISLAGVFTHVGEIDQAGGKCVFNDDSGDYNFVVESDDEANMFFLDAGLDRIGIVTGTPIADLDVNGTFNVTSKATLATYNYEASTEVADAYVIAFTPALVSYIAGLVIYLDPDIDNTGACTLAVNGMAAKSIKLLNGADPANSDILHDGIAVLVYDGTNFQLINPQ